MRARRRSSEPSTSNSATRDSNWPTMSGKPVWRRGKKGVHRVQPDLPVLRVCGEVSLLPAAVGGDRAWRLESSTGLLLLPSVPAELHSLRRGAGTHGRHQSGADAAGMSGRDAAALCRCGERYSQALCGSASVDLDRAAEHRSRWGAVAGAAERGADGPAAASGAEMDSAAS